MRKLIMSTLMTLDGVVEDPGGFSDFSLRGWGNSYFDDEAQQLALSTLLGADLLLYGRVTYEFFSGFWPSARGPYADRLNSLPKLVASTTLREPLEWNAKVIEGDVAEEVGRLKGQAGGDIVMYGSTNLMYTLTRHDLIDEYRIWVYPLVLGNRPQAFLHPGRTQGPPPGQHLAPGLGRRRPYLPPSFAAYVVAEHTLAAQQLQRHPRARCLVASHANS